MKWPSPLTKVLGTSSNQLCSIWGVCLDSWCHYNVSLVIKACYSLMQSSWFSLVSVYQFCLRLRHFLYIFVANGCRRCNHMTLQWHFRTEAKFCPLGWSRLHSLYTAQKFIGISGCDVKGKCHMKDLQVNSEHEKEHGRMEQKYSGNVT